MRCPKCGLKMNNAKYCFHCGYMTNGNTIDTKKKLPPTTLELYFGADYDKYTRNKNWLISGLLGPTYIFCHNNYFVGLLLIILDSFISLTIMIFNHAFIFYYVILLFNVLYWFINRLLWATIGNMLYLKLLTLKLEKLKKTKEKYFQKEITNLYSKNNKFIIFKYIIFGLLFYFIFNYLKTILYAELYLY